MNKITIYNEQDTMEITKILIKNRYMVHIRQITEELPFDEGEYEIRFTKDTEGEQE